MSEQSERFERIDLTRAEDPRDVVHRAVACLAQGGVVAMPTESSYILAASALNENAVGRILESTGTRPMPLLVKGADELADWVPDVSGVARRIARRCWPGPITLIVEGAVDQGLARRLPEAVRAAVASQQAIGLRCPAHPVVQDVLHLVAGPIVARGGKQAGTSPAVSAESLQHLPGIDLLLDEGAIRGPVPSTVVRITGERWTILRPGRLDAAELSRRAGTMILFVCTGNTCRSPMAEALCKLLLAERLRCDPTELEQRGYHVLSAGIAALEGMPAAAHAIETVRERGGALSEHTSRRVTPELIRSADLILTMTGDHLDAVIASYAEAADRARPLHAEGRDIPDPIGADRATYRQTAELISQQIQHLLDELNL